MVPIYLTDTEVAVQMFDLYDRVYRYPLEVTLEAMAPTTEYDFTRLPQDKQTLYGRIQQTHLHASPDGPWFFILARSFPDDDRVELLAVTDTSMLRPQVFALYEDRAESTGEMVQIGLVASERQAINACLRSLAAENERFEPVADRYWVARGGSYTDGGGFRFEVTRNNGLVCKNKFGTVLRISTNGLKLSSPRFNTSKVENSIRKRLSENSMHAFENKDPIVLWDHLEQIFGRLSWEEFGWLLQWLRDFARGDDSHWRFSYRILTFMRDRKYPAGRKKRASVLARVDQTLSNLFGLVPLLSQDVGNDFMEIRRLDWDSRDILRPPASGERTLILDAEAFAAEGAESAALWMVRAYQLGWKQLITFNWRGGRFAGCGFGSKTGDLRVDLFGDVGDYAGSGLDGAVIHLHGDGQDQLGQIIKSGKLVIYGDVGQTFLYGAKGGEIYVQGSAAGRPLINAVGKPRVVINGVCLDYLAESFMAGNPLLGGGFVILNGVFQDENGQLNELPTPYPGGNLFSLASGGAIYLRDPHRDVSKDQLNGGVLEEISNADWALIEPYLRENERLFGISVDDLLKLNGKAVAPHKVFRKATVGNNTLRKELANR
jgi:glutamate synthase domain-containing protein 3